MLRSDHPHSIRSYVIVSGEVYYRAFAELFYSVKKGKTGSEAAFGKSFFAYLGEHTDIFEHFNIHMSRRVHQPGTPAYADALQAALEQSLDQATLFFLTYLWECRDSLLVIHPWLRAAVRALCEGSEEEA